MTDLKILDEIKSSIKFHVVDVTDQDRERIQLGTQDGVLMCAIPLAAMRAICDQLDAWWEESLGEDA